MRAVHIEARLEKLGIKLQPPTPPKGNYVRGVRSGNLFYMSGHIPQNQTDGTMITGKVGGDVTPEEARDAARMIALSMVSSLKAELGDLDRVNQVVKLVGFVNCVHDFTEQVFVLNGASDAMIEVFEEKGVHARSAVGTNTLPLGISVEIEAIIEINDG
ncbi:unnamed protein product [Chrysoparadoxa australica]